MLRFEKIDLYHVSWWDLPNTADPPQTPDFTTKALTKLCGHCLMESRQVLEPGWVCLNEACPEYSVLNGAVISEGAKRNPDFVNERTKFADLDGLPDLIPSLPDPDSVDAACSTERNSWKGIVCPKCQRCNCRTYWDAWRCATEGCDFVLPVKHQIHSVGSLVADNLAEYSGRALLLNECHAPVVEHDPEYFGYWRIQKYTLFSENSVTHFMANSHINRKPGGAHQILREMQEVDLGLRRYSLASCNGNHSDKLFDKQKLTFNSQGKSNGPLFGKFCGFNNMEKHLRCTNKFVRGCHTCMWFLRTPNHSEMLPM